MHKAEDFVVSSSQCPATTVLNQHRIGVILAIVSLVSRIGCGYQDSNFFAAEFAASKNFGVGPPFEATDWGSSALRVFF
jgi:hypothetical protein